MATLHVRHSRAFILASVILLIYSGCTGRVAPDTRSGGTTSLKTDQEARKANSISDEQITQQDLLVVEAVLLDLLANEECFTEMNFHGGEENEIILDAKTGGESFYLRLGQIRGELDEGQLIPDALGNELSRRNKNAVSLADFKPDNPSVLVQDLTELPDGIEFSEAFVMRFPNAKAYVDAWLPAYSNDGTTALVRFWFGPTPHGAAGTYMLVEEGGRWKVLWRSLAYFA